MNSCGLLLQNLLQSCSQRWLTTSQMGWALTREENEITNDREERDGKRVARLSSSTDYQPVHQSALAIE
jgi:hypothetical protein